ncbi:MAG: DUF1385 domain-containing protein [Candidatus Eiseniibacteriota bacterium]|nr:MAG: DUF1385 domain-containing protein [Candidatus Eisenbacteria bacterium]
MMRSPKVVATAVRRPAGDITVRKRPFVSLSRRKKMLGLPVLRGAVILIETLSLGLSALTYSAEEALNEEGTAAAEESGAVKKPGGAATTASLVATVIVSLGIAFLLFFYLPLFVAERMGVQSGFWFNVVDGAVRLAVFVLYIRLVGLWGEMRKLYQYHGAEHKSIHAFEAREELTVENAMKHSTLHARCGTSFLLMVVIISLFVFIALGKPESWGERGIRFLFIPFIAGVAFEFTKLSGKHAKKAWASILIKPGLWLQRMTTREPTREQVEVALRALREVL